MKSLIILMLMALSQVLADNNPIILDTDIGPDYDDVGALAILHTFADKGMAKILATVASNKYEGVAAVLSVFNTYFKRPEIPIGVPKGNAVDLKDSQHWTEFIRSHYPHKIQNNSEAADSVSIYRQVLAKQSDHSVTIITIGFLTNLANLLSTPPDSNSHLNGSDLVKLKVKQLVSMAGAFPSGREFNIYEDSASAKKVFETWPTPIIFSGFEIGNKVKTGLPLIHNNSIHNSPVKDVFNISIPKAKEDSNGRCSWDETAVLVGVEGYSPYYDIQSGRIKVTNDGSNTWDKNSVGMAHLIEKMPVSSVEEYLNQLMMR